MAQPTPLSSPVCRDADDDMVLATAVAGQAEVIVSGDADLLTLGAYEGIRILSPRQFVEMLDAQA
jgi:predicted nucleic acid-binding protein